MRWSELPAFGLTASFVSGASQSMPLCAFWMRSIHQPTAASTVLLCYVCWLVSSWEPLSVRRYQRLDSSLGRSVWRLSRSTSSRMPPSRHVLAYFRRMFRVRSLSALAQPNLQALVRQPRYRGRQRWRSFRSFCSRFPPTSEWQTVQSAVSFPAVQLPSRSLLSGQPRDPAPSSDDRCRLPLRSL